MKNPISIAQGQAKILGKDVHQGDMDQAIARIDELISTSRPNLVVTANVDHIIDLYDGTPLREAYDAAALRVIDGVPVAKLMNALGDKSVRRVTGADMIDDLTAHAKHRNFRVAITGGKTSVCDQAAQNLRAKYAYDEIYSIPMPMLSSATDPNGAVVVEALEKVRPDIVFLCLGAPKQELYFLNWSKILPPAVYIGAGAAVDFAAGNVKRAPLWMQRFGLEWVHRMTNDFKRLAPRYLVKGPRFALIAFDALMSNKNR